MLRRTTRQLQRQHTSNVFRAPTDAIPLSEAVKAHRATGQDAARNTTLDFLELQANLIPYRFTRLVDEVRELRRNPGHMATLEAIPFAAKLVAFFFLGWFMCRGMTVRTYLVPNDGEHTHTASKHDAAH
jgi:hypothetical protein